MASLDFSTITEAGEKRNHESRKALPKTGLMDVDEEAVIVQSCLARLHESVAVSPRKRPPKAKIINGPAGGSLDISHRADMGNTPNEEPSSEEKKRAREEAEARSDAVIAQVSLARLMRICAESLDRHEALIRENVFMTDHVVRQKKQIAELTAKVASLENQLEMFKDPKTALQNFREAYDREHHLQQRQLLEEAGGKQKLLDALLAERRQARAKQRIVNEKRSRFDTLSAQMNNEFGKDEAMFASVMKVFQPKPLTIQPVKRFASIKEQEDAEADAEEAAKHPLPDFGFDSTITLPRQHKSSANASPRSDDKSSQNNTANPLAEDLDDEMAEMSTEDDGAGSPYSPTQQTSFMQTTTTIHDVLQEVDTLLSEEIHTSIHHKTAKQRAEEEEQKRQKRAVEEMVITRFTTTKARYVKRQDPDASLLTMIQNLMLYSKSTYLAMRVDMHTTLGRMEQLIRQANALNLLNLWNELCLYTMPILYVVTFPFVTQRLVVETKSPGGSPTKPIVGEVGANDGDQLDARLERETHIVEFPLESAHPLLLSEAEAIQGSVGRQLLALKRIPEQRGERPSRKYGAAPAHAAQEEVPLVTVKQKPGIIAFLGSNFGEESTMWVNPINAGHVRFYSSSMLGACTVDALAMSFKDIHYPYFSTRDEPGEHVTMSFSSSYVVPTGYSIASCHPVHGGYYPRNWRFEASVDGVAWFRLREHVSDDALSRYHPVGHFAVDARIAVDGLPNGVTADDKEKISPVAFQHFRIVQTGHNALGTQHLCVSSFEVYGRFVYVLDSKPQSITKLPPRGQRPSGFALPTELPPCVAKAAPKKGGGKKKK